MSHFVGVVITGKTKKSLESILEPYSEGLEVEPYEDECWCSGKDKTCECKGTGIRMTTYNPDSKWDWWRVGGRWDGWITNTKVKSKDNGFNFDDSHESLEKNSLSVKDYIKEIESDNKFLPYALITSENWMDTGGGWFDSMSDKDKLDWKSIILKELKKPKNKKLRVIACDFHI